ncbi:MAG: beta-lactamase family protein [Proteobacteria bacterium]|nr:beta-lactamase family protein [Pseudomonadota bacterium]
MPREPHGMEGEFESILRAYAGLTPGAAVAVLRRGEPLLLHASGLADLDARTPVTPATQFRLASVSKQFTAAALLLLAEQGRLELDDAVRDWLPTLPSATRGVTLRHLLTHTSGIADFEALIEPERCEPLSDADVLRLIEREPHLQFPPGTRFCYSNTGYILLALVIERAARCRYASFLRERIFEPLGMRHAVAHEAGLSVVAHRAFGYTWDGQSWQRTDQSLTSATLGDGGIYASVEELARWDAAIEGGRLLPPARWQEALSAVVATGKPGIGYGFGWRVGHGAAWHSGETVGFRNLILRLLEPRLTVIVLTNRSAPSPYPLAAALARRYEPQAVLPPDEPAAGPDAAARLLPGTTVSAP